MSSANNIAAANKAFSDAADKVEHLLGQAWQLDADDPQHLAIAMEMGRALVSPFYNIVTLPNRLQTNAMMSHAGNITHLSPLILSAAAELQQHMNPSRTSLTGTPVWANIRGDDVRIQTHPLFPLTRNFRHSQSQSSSPSPPRQGPSQPRKRPAAEEPEQRGRGTERGKRPRAASARSCSRPAMSKRQQQKAKAIITSDDELDEEAAAPPIISVSMFPSVVSLI